MEFHSPIYELLYDLECRGKIHPPKVPDLMTPEALLEYITTRTKGVSCGPE